MDELTAKIAARLAARMYPLLSPETGPHLWPFGIQDFLRDYEPAHIITLTPHIHMVDGLDVKSSGDMQTKRLATLKALRHVYGTFKGAAPNAFEVPSEYACSYIRTFMSDTYKISVSPKKVLILKSFSEHNVPHVDFLGARNNRMRVVYPVLMEIVRNPFGKSVYPQHLEDSYTYIVSFKKDFLRFAFLAKTAQLGCSEQDVSITPVTDKDMIGTTIARNGLPFKEQVPQYSLSNEFFAAPIVENTKTIGDLCFLTQAKKGWTIHTKIKTPYSDGAMNLEDVYSLYSTMRLLQIAPGFDNLMKTANVQLLLTNEKTWEPTFWRILAVYADGLKNRGAIKAETIANRIFNSEQKRRP